MIATQAQFVAAVRALRQANHAARIFAALYASEGWQASWQSTKRLHSKARALVVFDRVLNEKWRNMTKPTEDECAQRLLDAAKDAGVNSRSHHPTHGITGGKNAN